MSLSSEQWGPWLHRSAGDAYEEAGHVLPADELERGLSSPADYITEHSGIDPIELEHLPHEDAAKEFAKGIRRNVSESNAMGSAVSDLEASEARDRDEIDNWDIDNWRKRDR